MSHLPSGRLLNGQRLTSLQIILSGWSAIRRLTINELRGLRGVGKRRPPVDRLNWRSGRHRHSFLKKLARTELPGTLPASPWP